MNALYIDFTHSIPRKKAKVHGGGNFTKQVLIDLEDYLSLKESKDMDVNLICPKEYSPQNDVENKIFNSKYYKRLYTDCLLDEISYKPNSTLFLPLLGVKEFPLLKSIKRNNPKLRLILTVHGLRLLDLPPDNYDRAYLVTAHDEFLYWIKDRILLGLRKEIYKNYVRNYIPWCDVVLTDSNYSLSRIYELSKVKKNILMTLDATVDEKEQIRELSDSNYMLFVSGNRSEKNLARTLVAYKHYIETKPTIQSMLITGVSSEIEEKIIRFCDIRDLVQMNKITFKGYVSHEELQKLYKNAAYLVYTSKSEGYGLPALEAAYHGCLTMAAIGTSIPEVLGNGAFYVSPYSEESIVDGMLWMDKKENRRELLKRMNIIIESVQERIRISNDILYHLLFEEE